MVVTSCSSQVPLILTNTQFYCPHYYYNNTVESQALYIIHSHYFRKYTWHWILALFLDC
jgi:hypothetical protein